MHGNLSGQCVPQPWRMRNACMACTSQRAMRAATVAHGSRVYGVHVASDLQVDMSVAADNARLLKELLETAENPADSAEDPVVQSLAARCRVMLAGVQRVIQKVQDESVMAAALQVCAAPPCAPRLACTPDALTLACQMNPCPCAPSSRCHALGHRAGASCESSWHSYFKVAACVLGSADAAASSGARTPLACACSLGRCSSGWLALQVHDQVNAVLEEHDAAGGPERTASTPVAPSAAGLTGMAGMAGATAVAPMAVDSPHLAPPTAAPAPGAGMPDFPVAPAATSAGPDLIDFGDEKEAAHKPAPPAPAAPAGGSIGGSGGVVAPNVAAEKQAIYDDFDALVAEPNATSEPAAAAVEDAFDNLSLQPQPVEPKSKSENPFL
jgi:hypothetical protein